MKRYELDVVHSYKNKFVGQHRLTSQRDLVVLGQTMTADIRLLGDEVSGVHAFIENTDKGWLLVDAGSSTGTWINKSPVQIEPITTEKTISIGGHQLKLIPRLVEGGLFTPDKVKNRDTTGTKSFHQIIVRNKGAIIRTELIGEHEPFLFVHEGKTITLNAPKLGEWLEEGFGTMTLQRRLVKTDDVKMSAGEYLKNFSASDLKTPIIVALVLLFLVTGLIVLMPTAPDEKIAEVSKENQFTRMIFDAKVLKKKREEAMERRTVMKKTAGNQNAGGPGNDPGTTPVASKSAAPQVISKLQGISSLIGKISKRASMKAVQIVSSGKAADELGTGRALAAVSSLQGVATSVGNGGETYKVGGIGTIGKGGGNGKALGALGSLTSGGAGNASVGILDEETEIEGGLDKDVIARVIQNQLGEVRYCYERQLSADPELYGKVQVKFTIDGSGSVVDQRVGNTTLNSAMVEGCILRRMARWRFPKPKGGTHVLVTYPFMFKSTN